MKFELKQPWVADAELAKGGFGRVLRGHGPDGAPVAIKLIPKSPGLERELLFEDLADTTNVVPVLDAGEDEDHLIIVMPLAERSLRDQLGAAGGALPEDEAAKILLDVADGLASLEGRVVHRDLKPENVLLLEGRWCLADFGIARYAEATTATWTLKGAMTMAYAAPEQWRYERATAATDMYAFGVMAFEMLSGRIPFPGPKESDFREQHLYETPQALPVSADLASIVAECLLKAANARPSAANVAARLRARSVPKSPAQNRLQQLNRSAVEAKATELARLESEKSSRETRKELQSAADTTFASLLETLAKAVLEAAPEAGSNNPWKLNGVELGVQGPFFSNHREFVAPGYRPAFDVVTHAAIYVRFPVTRYGYSGRAHGLWYCDAQVEGKYRWFENAFMLHPYARSSRDPMNPVARDPDGDTAMALSGGADVWQLAWPFTAIDQGGEADFIERWLNWFADAVEGKRQHPTQMPERPTKGSYREPVPEPREIRWPTRD